MKYDRRSGGELDFYSGEQSLNHMQWGEVWKRNGLWICMMFQLKTEDHLDIY